MREERIKTEPMCYKTRVWTDFKTDKIRYSRSIIISLRWEREGTWLGSHMTWCHRARRV